MTNLERDIRSFILRALLRTRDHTMADSQLRIAIRSAFMAVTFTEGDLKSHITGCEDANWISGTEDELLGIVWSLTPKGKIKAQQL